MKTNRLPSVHPGEVLLEEFLKPGNISQYRLAKAIGIPESRISSIISKERGISADTALRLARFFGTSAQLWLNLQNQYDLEQTEREKHSLLEKIQQHHFAAA